MSSFIPTHEQDVLKKELLEKFDRLKYIETHVNKNLQSIIGSNEIDFNTILLPRSGGKSLLQEREILKKEIIEIVEKLNSTFGIDWNGNSTEEEIIKTKLDWN